MLDKSCMGVSNGRTIGGSIMYQEQNALIQKHSGRGFNISVAMIIAYHGPILKRLRQSVVLEGEGSERIISRRHDQLALQAVQE